MKENGDGEGGNWVRWELPGDEEDTRVINGSPVILASCFSIFDTRDRIYLL